MIWVDREVKKIKERNFSLEWVDDMKTPSGKIHVGALRGVVIHDLVYKVLVENEVNTKFTYIFDDHDPMDAIPAYLEYEKWEQYAGMQLYKIPSPEKGYASFAEYYAKDFINVFESINCHPEIIWTSQLYNSGKMNGVIKEALDEADVIREIYKAVAKAEKPKDWYPFNVVCENCQKVGTTQVYKWDGTHVYYRCIPQMVAWAKGCDHEGRISPFNGKGKLPWQLDWPAKWKVVGVTVEGGGKDHMSAGGSHDRATEFCKRVFQYPVPYPLPYEWFTIGGRKMSTSKGVGASAEAVSKILPSNVFRFLIVRTPIGTALDFNPYGDTILNLFDDYDRCLEAYFDKLEGNIPEGKPGEVLSDFARIIELSEVKPLPQKRLFLSRFRTIVNVIKTKADLLDFFGKQKGHPLTEDEKAMLEEREIYAQVYLDNYASEESKTELIDKIPEDIELSENQRKFLQLLGENLKTTQSTDREEIQQMVFNILKDNNLKAREVFKAFYKILTGKEYGPKASDIILEFGVDTVIEHIQQVTGTTHITEKTPTKNLFPQFTDTSIFSIDSELAKKYPSLHVGVALMKGITIKKADIDLQKEVNVFLDSQTDLTTEMISTYPEIQSYRKLYKEMGVDWHSRRPSPEALLRRVALKKGLYSINACVDAYNLVVMRNHVSSGAFDLDTISFPTVLRFAKEGEEILLLGDKEPTKYKPTEVAYSDQKGGFNIDFNYRDAQRTVVSESTKNLFINIDGVFSITREQVEKTLQETIEIIKKYCGGTVETAGIISAK